MIEYSNGDLFWEDYVDKQLIITCGEKIITNELIYFEEFSLTQSVCSESELKFGGCESSMIEFKIRRDADINVSYGDELDVQIVLMKNYDNPLRIGKFIVTNCAMVNNRKFLNVTAYDKMYDLKQINISKWIDGLTFPIKLNEFRKLLFKHLNCEYVETDLVNDDINLYRATRNGDVYAGDVLKDICSLNACFGIINNDGNFEFKRLNTDSDHVDYVLEKRDYEQNGFEFELFKTQPITSIWLQEKANNEDWLYLEGTNVYALELNSLYVGDNVNELNTVCANFYEAVKDITYRPYALNNVIGNFCVECGDKFSAVLTDGEWSSKENLYILERKITGIQSLKDTYTTQGVESYSYYNEAQKALSNIESQISNLSKDIFGALTIVNSDKYTIEQDEIDIIQFNIATSDIGDSEAVFITTIPIYVDYNCIIEIKYKINSEVQTYSTVKKYLNQGYNIVTLTNHFSMENSNYMVLTVSARLLIDVSVQDEHTAYIQAFKNYIETGIYEEPDTSQIFNVPTGKIEQEAIKSTVFVQNLVKGAKWDGMITVAEQFTAIEFDIKLDMPYIIDETDAELNDIVEKTTTQKLNAFTWNNTYTLSSLEDDITIEQEE